MEVLIVEIQNTRDFTFQLQRNTNQGPEPQVAQTFVDIRALIEVGYQNGYDAFEQSRLSGPLPCSAAEVVELNSDG